MKRIDGDDAMDGLGRCGADKPLFGEMKFPLRFFLEGDKLIIGKDKSEMAGCREQLGGSRYQFVKRKRIVGMASLPAPLIGWL